MYHQSTCRSVLRIFEPRIDYIRLMEQVTQCKLHIFLKWVYSLDVLCYIKNCIDTVTVNKRIWVYLIQKPWMTREVQQLLKQRNIDFKSSPSMQQGPLQCSSSQPEERHQGGQGRLQEEDRGPSGEEQQQAGVARCPTPHKLQDQPWSCWRWPCTHRGAEHLLSPLWGHSTRDPTTPRGPQ